MELFVAFIGGFVVGIMVAVLICHSATLLVKQHYKSDITEDDLPSYRNPDVMD